VTIAFVLRRGYFSLYVTELAKRRRSATIGRRRLAALSVTHRLAGYPTPTPHEVVSSVVRGIRRRLGVAQA
jgi:hypothetical protein